MTVGVCYFPEHWPRERWAKDVAEMAEADIEYVRMGEFAWGRIEAERGDIDLSWLDEALSLIGERGMEAVLCTPTATPPKWLVDERPDILQEERDGTVREHGSRRHYCFNSDAYREETERIVTLLAEHYVDHPVAAGWQTDNEYGCHGTVRCYCDDCAAAFRDWLHERYGDSETLNEAWGNAFWSQQYGSIAAVDPPGHTPAEQHPSRLLDYYRFSSDSVVAYDALQTDLLRAANDDWFLTHNFVGDFQRLDAYAVGENHDFLSWDAYPTGLAQNRPGEQSADELRAGHPDRVGLNHAVHRGATGTFWVMELQPGDINWPPHSPQPGEGAMRLWAHQAVAHGADATCYFRWRRCRQGQEQYHAGLRKADGSADRGYRDAARTAEELVDLGPVDAPVAVLHDYEHQWALSEQPHSPDWDYWALLETFYGAVRARGVQADLIHPDDDLGGYDAVFAPALYLVGDDRASHLRDYAERGGALLLGPRTGAKDPYNKLHDSPKPGPLADLAGATVDQHESLPDHLPTRVAYDGEEYAFRAWAEWLAPEGATVRGEYSAGAAAERPALTRNQVGDGTVRYCGCWPESDLADALATELLDDAGVAYGPRAPEGVRVAERDGHSWVLNFTSDPVAVDAPDAAERVVGEEMEGETETVGAYDLSIVRAPASDIGVEKR
jgi:beta-galactosidase